MRFIQELRSQGKTDLALEYLQRISKTASPELAKQLPLELAKAKLDAAGDEPDSGKRLSLYSDARDELQKWLTANPASPRAGEVKLDIAQVAVMQGRTQLSRPLMNPDFAEEMTPGRRQGPRDAGGRRRPDQGGRQGDRRPARQGRRQGRKRSWKPPGSRRTSTSA